MFCHFGTAFVLSFSELKIYIMYERQKRITLARMTIVLIWQQTHSIAFDDLTIEMEREQNKDEPFVYKSKEAYISELKNLSFKITILNKRWGALKKLL